LILFADNLGYGFSYGDAADTNKNDGHMKNSNHHYRLAVDLNLILDRGKGEYIRESTHPAWGELHSYWENHLGGAPMIISDANHFSFEHNGNY
jgi:hypothetical protein